LIVQVQCCVASHCGSPYIYNDCYKVGDPRCDGGHFEPGYCPGPAGLCIFVF
jgi:hypothetical protein